MIIAPVRWDFKIAQWFGENPKIYQQFWLKWHNWQDLELPIWTNIYAPFDWICEIFNDKTGYGKHIKIFWQPYNKEWHYRAVLLAHLSEILVDEWFEVKGWDIIWKSGNTWYSFFNWKEYPTWGGYAHLHWQLRRHNKWWAVLNYDNWYKGSEDIFEKGYILENKVSKY